MKNLDYSQICLLLLGCLVVNGCQKERSLPQDPTIQVYFNQRQTNSYQDPYRKIKRPGDDLEKVIIDAIAAANTRIDVAVQELQLPQVAQALAQKANQGVRVRVVLDHKYSQPISSLSQSQVNKLSSRERQRYQQYFRLIDRDRNGTITKSEAAKHDSLVILEQAGIKVIDDTADGSKGSGLMHHKFLVIDGQTVLTGSTNLTLSGTHGDLGNPLTRGNANHLLVIDNAELASLFTAEFSYLWGTSDQPQFGLDKPYRTPQTVYLPNGKITVQFSPTSRKQDWQKSTNGLIGATLEQATSSVDLALFVFSEQQLANILESKQPQIRVRGLIDEEFIFRYYSEALDLLGVELPNKCQYETANNPWQQPLTTIGKANLVPGDKLHHKFAIIDKQTAISGSQNWSAAGNHNNDEAVLIIENSTVAQHFQQEFERLYQSARLGLPSRIKTKITQAKQKCRS